MTAGPYLVERVASVAHNALMADEWSDLPPNGIERAAWEQVALAVLRDLGLDSEEKAP